LKGTLAAHGDGETLCTACQQFDLEILPRELDLIVQKKG